MGGACGMWGVIAAALFDFGPGFNTLHGWDGFSIHKDGEKLTTVGDSILAALAQIGFIWAWSGGISCIVFGGLNATGHLRVEARVEDKGLDKGFAVEAYSTSAR